jgi:hypothetical protein
MHYYEADAVVIEYGARTPRTVPFSLATTIRNGCCAQKSRRYDLFAAQMKEAGSRQLAACSRPRVSSTIHSHGSATITLNVYAHLFSKTDDSAAIAIEAALGKL